MMDSLSFFDNQQPRSAKALLKELNLIQISDLFPSSLSFSAAQDYPTSPSSVENNSPTSNFNFSQAFPSELALASSSFIDPSPPPLYSSSKPIPVIQSEPSFPFSSSWPLEPTHNMMPTAPIPVGPELRFEWRLGGPDMFVKPVGLVVFRLKPEGSERFTDPLLLVADMHRNAIVVLNLAGWKIHTIDVTMPCKIALNVSRPGEVFVLSPHPHSYVIVYDFFSGLARTLMTTGRQAQVPPSKAQFGRGELMNPRLICCDRLGRVLVMESRGQMRLLVFSEAGVELGCFPMQDYFEFPSAMTTWPPAHPTFSVNDCLSQAAAHSSNGSVLHGAATADEDEIIFIADHRLNLVHAFDYNGSLLFSISGDGRVDLEGKLPKKYSTAARGAALSYNDRRSRVNGCGFKRPSCLFVTPGGCLVVLDNDHFQLHATAISLPLNTPLSHRSRASESITSSGSSDSLLQASACASASASASSSATDVSSSPVSLTFDLTGQGIGDLWANSAAPPQLIPSSSLSSPLSQLPTNGVTTANQQQATLLGPQLLELLNTLLNLNLSNRIPPAEGLPDRQPSMRSRLRSRRSLQMCTYKAWSGPTSTTSPSLNQGASAAQMTNPTQHCHGATPDLQYLGTAGVDLCPLRLLTVRDHFRSINGSPLGGSSQMTTGISDIEGRVFLVSSCDDGYVYLHSFAPAP